MNHQTACLLAAVLAAVVVVLEAAPRADLAPQRGIPTCGVTPRCPSKKAALLPNTCPGGCEYYYECDKDGVATARSCLPWQNFDPKKAQCVFWDMVDCAASVQPEPSPAPGGSSPAPAGSSPAPGGSSPAPGGSSPADDDASPSPAPTTPEPVVPGCDFVPECPVSGSQNIGIPCPDSCRQYVACVDGSYTVESCGTFKRYFDTVSGKCVAWGATCAA